jgi:hypothetical protein
MQDIDLYYESIYQVYLKIKEGRQTKTSIWETILSGILAVSGFCLFLSVVPIIPFAITFVLDYYDYTIGSFSFAQPGLREISVIWVSSFVITVIIFFASFFVMSKIDSLPASETKPTYSLSSEQYAFLDLYEAYKELRVYFVSYVDEHVDNCLKALRRTQPMPSHRHYTEQALVNQNINSIVVDNLYLESDIPPRVRITKSIPSQIVISREFLKSFEKYPWFQLDTDTKETLQALISFHNKILPRLRKREDLPAVLTILESFCKFTYAYLPDHKAHKSTEQLNKLHSEGFDYLRKFVDQVNQLTPFAPEKADVITSRQEKSAGNHIVRLLQYNIFARFALWFILVLTLTSVTVLLIYQYYPNLDINIMISTIIGASVAGAATLAIIIPKSIEKERNSNASIGKENKGGTASESDSLDKNTNKTP